MTRFSISLISMALVVLFAIGSLQIYMANVRYVKVHEVEHVYRCSGDKCLIKTDREDNVYVRNIINPGMTVYENCTFYFRNNSHSCWLYLSTRPRSAIDESQVLDIRYRWDTSNFLKKLGYMDKITSMESL